MHTPPPENLDARGLRIGIAVSRYHEHVTSKLAAGAQACFERAGGRVDQLIIVSAPGAFELPVIARKLVAGQPRVDGVIALGCVITGETTHDQYINQAVANALTTLAADTGTPVAFGVLTCQTMEQAEARAGGAHGHKGEEAMAAVLETIHTLRELDHLARRTVH